VERALIRAGQAEELAEARAELNQQALLTVKQKQRLEEGISSILETHQQVASGNLAARAPVHEDQELWQIGHALNLLLMRLQQQAQDYRNFQNTYQEIDQIVHVLDATRTGARPSLPSCRTSLAQRLLGALRR
jgi:methyl-accepting chemotaxis protein